MIIRRIFFLVVLFGICVLTGCAGEVDYDPNLFKPDQATCWPCQMYMQTFTAVSNLLTGALKVMCSNSMMLLQWGLMFWLIAKVFPWLVSLTPPKINEDIKVIAKTLLKAMMVSFFLLNSQYIYDILGKVILQPIGTVFMRVSELVLVSPSSVGVSVSNYSQSNWTTSASLGGLLDMIGDIFSTAKGKVSDVINAFEGAFGNITTPNGTKIKMPSNDPMFGTLPMQIQSVIWQIYDALWSGMGLVYQLWQAKSWAAVIAGVFLMWGLWSLLVYLPMTFADAFLCLGLTVVLLPLMMVAWVFPIGMGKNMWKKVSQTVLRAFFDILFNCIYVAFLVSVIRVYVKEKIPHIFSSDYQTSESGLRQSGINMTMEFILMVVLIYAILKLSKHVGEITNQFFDGTPVQSSVGKFLDRFKKLALTTGKALFRVAVTGGVDWSGFKDVGQQAMALQRDVSHEMADGGAEREALEAKDKYGNRDAEGNYSDWRENGRKADDYKDD